VPKLKLQALEIEKIRLKLALGKSFPKNKKNLSVKTKIEGSPFIKGRIAQHSFYTCM
jgi:hypothetical protein